MAKTNKPLPPLTRIACKAIYAVSTGTYRNVEDWRKVDVRERTDVWAVHCVDHDERTFLSSYQRAKDIAEWPSTCPACKAFYNRCIYCPVDRDQFKTNSRKGFTSSTGHIQGNAVCNKHRFGSIPDGIDYAVIVDSDLQTPVAEVFGKNSLAGAKAFTIKYLPEQSQFWICSHAMSDFSPAAGAEYHLALGFALAIAAAFNESLNPPNGTPRYYESWEDHQARELRAR